MIELANDIVIRCRSCGEVIYRQRELYDPSESYYERNMGSECIAAIRDELECPNCGNEISFELGASSYAFDVHNEQPVIEGGVFLEQPLMQLIGDEGVWDFDRWAYDEADDVRRLVLDSAQNREYMYNLHPRDFELMVEQIFIDKGFRTELTPTTRDGGKDIIAKRYIGTRIPIVIYIECKRFGPDRAVGEPIIRGLYGVMTDAHINKGILVTSSYFSRDAFVFTRRQGDLIELINGDALYKMIQKSANRYYDSMQQ